LHFKKTSDSSNVSDSSDLEHLVQCHTAKAKTKDFGSRPRPDTTTTKPKPRPQILALRPRPRLHITDHIYTIRRENNYMY